MKTQTFHIKYEGHHLDCEGCHTKANSNVTPPELESIEVNKVMLYEEDITLLVEHHIPAIEKQILQQI